MSDEITRADNPGGEIPDFERRLELAVKMIGPAKRIVLLLTSPASGEADQQLAVQLVKLRDILGVVRDSGLPYEDGPEIYSTLHPYREFRRGFIQTGRAWTDIQAARFYSFGWDFAVNGEVDQLRAGVQTLLEFCRMATLYDTGIFNHLAKQTLQLRIDRETTGMQAATGSDDREPLVPPDESEASSQPSDVLLKLAEIQKVLKDAGHEPPDKKTVSKQLGEPCEMGADRARRWNWQKAYPILSKRYAALPLAPKITR